MVEWIIKIKIVFYWVLVKIKNLLKKFWELKLRDKLIIFLIIIALSKDLRVLLFKGIITVLLWFN